MPAQLAFHDFVGWKEGPFGGHPQVMGKKVAGKKGGDPAYKYQYPKGPGRFQEPILVPPSAYRQGQEGQNGTNDGEVGERGMQGAEPMSQSVQLKPSLIRGFSGPPG
jgi:hypothetical protein